MKIFGAINDGYRFIYSEDETIMRDWLYIHQEHFCILKIFLLEIADDMIVKKNCDLNINYNFYKKSIPQENYKEIMNEKLSNKIGVIFTNGIAEIVDTEDNEHTFKLELNYEEKIILKATRNYQ